MTTSARRANISVVCTSPANRIADAWLSDERRSAKVGTKAFARAPSAVNRRNMLGNFNATRKASAAGPAPRNAAKATSRRNPRIRLMPVRPLIRRKAAARDIALIPQPRSHDQTPPAGATGSPRGAPHYAPADHTDLSHRKHRQRVRHKSIPWQSGFAGPDPPTPW